IAAGPLGPRGHAGRRPRGDFRSGEPDDRPPGAVLEELEVPDHRHRLNNRKDVGTWGGGPERPPPQVPPSPYPGHMSLARRLLIRASRSPWLAEQFRRRAFARRAVRRFMPGEDLEAALDAASRFAAEHIGAVLTELGEQVRSRDEADAVRRHYLQVLGEIERRRLGSHVSVKLTHLGLESDAGGCRRDVIALAARARGA